jgi:hypothetical protein
LGLFVGSSRSQFGAEMQRKERGGELLWNLQRYGL